jgi:transcriptional regulator with XRE-family HTH domain
MKALGLRIKKYRESLGLSQEALAKLLGVSRPTLSQMENESRKVSAEEARKIGDIFGVSLDALFDEKREPKFVIKEERAEYRRSEPEVRIDIPRKNFGKFREVFLYILDRIGARPNVGETVIYKILYFIDFDYYERYEEQLIGATYKKNKHGPTPMEFRKIAEKMIADGDIMIVPGKNFNYPQTKYLPLRAPDRSCLSAQEVQTIDRVLARLSDMNAVRISEYSHDDVPWLTTEEGGIIPYEAVFYRTPAYSTREDGS